MEFIIGIYIGSHFPEDNWPSDNELRTIRHMMLDLQSNGFLHIDELNVISEEDEHAEYDSDDDHTEVARAA